MLQAVITSVVNTPLIYHKFTINPDVEEYSDYSSYDMLDTKNIGIAIGI